MSKLTFAAILLIGLVGSVSMQNFPDQSMGMQQGGGGLFSGLFGGNNNNNGGSGGGLGETIRQLPARGMQMLNNVFSGVRNILPGLGRNNNNYPMNQMNNMSQNQQGGPLDGVMNQLSSTLNMQNQQGGPLNGLMGQLSSTLNMQNPNLQNRLNGMQGNMQGAMNNMPNPMQNMQNPMQNMQNMQNPMQNMQNPLSNLMNRANNLSGVNLDNLSRPVTDALTQGRLPNMNEVSQGLSKTVSDAVRNLGNTASGPLNSVNL